jgi:hypothetical protein
MIMVFDNLMEFMGYNIPECNIQMILNAIVEVLCWLINYLELKNKGEWKW